MSWPRLIRVCITSGDPDGIGMEVASKALVKLGPQPGVQFSLWRSRHCPSDQLKPIDSMFNRMTVKSWPEALSHQSSSFRDLVDIDSELPPADWVKITAKACLFGQIDAMATAPLSKTSIAATGSKAIGHTDILKQITKSKNLFMAFVGEKFNVLLATGHLPLKEVSASLTLSRLEAAIHAANELRQVLPKTQRDLPIAIVGLNPHAGEEGLIGKEEQGVFAHAFNKFSTAGITLAGPLVPDAAFFPENWDRYSVYVCPYHDQGLIPFKMIHGQDSGVHITMGLPFVRTSVDHGTAKEIFGRDQANPNSMIDSLVWAIKLAKRKLGGADL